MSLWRSCQCYLSTVTVHSADISVSTAKFTSQRADFWWAWRRRWVIYSNLSWITFNLLHLDIEPFDEALDRHVWSLHDQRLGLHKTIATTRRTEPLKIEKAMLGSLEQDHQLDAMESAWEVPSEDLFMDVDDANGMWWILSAIISLIDETEKLQPEIEDGLHKTTAWAKELSQVRYFSKLFATDVYQCFQSIPHQTERTERLKNVTTELKKPEWRWMTWLCRILQTHLCNLFWIFLNLLVIWSLSVRWSWSGFWTYPRYKKL